MNQTTKVANAGAVGAALGVLIVMFMPESVYVFTPETAAMATAAFGTIFSYIMRFVPKPPVGL